MESLLLSLREIATSPPDTTGPKFGKKDDLSIRVYENTDLDDAGSDGSSDLQRVKLDFKRRQAKLNSDGKKLRAELNATKKMLNQALEYRTCKPAP